jgi:hypothetical protein
MSMQTSYFWYTSAIATHSLGSGMSTGVRRLYRFDFLGHWLYPWHIPYIVIIVLNMFWIMKGRIHVRQKWVIRQMSHVSRGLLKGWSRLNGNGSKKVIHFLLFLCLGLYGMMKGGEVEEQSLCWWSSHHNGRRDGLSETIYTKASAGPVRTNYFYVPSPNLMTW